MPHWLQKPLQVQRNLAKSRVLTFFAQCIYAREKSCGQVKILEGFVAALAAFAIAVAVAVVVTVECNIDPMSSAKFPKAIKC